MESFLRNRYFLYTGSCAASSTLWDYIALLGEEGRAFEPFLLRECNCDFSLSFFFYTSIYTSVEEEKYNTKNLENDTILRVLFWAD